MLWKILSFDAVFWFLEGKVLFEEVCLVSISRRGSEFRAGLLASVFTFSCTWVSFLFWV